MKRSICLQILLFSMAFFLCVGSAAAFTIDDNYIGGDPANNTYDGQDVIGDKNVFDIHGMNVTVSETGLLVDIYANYFDNIINNTNLLKTAMGDLFISTNGYNPVNPSSSDYYGVGEVWEYALVLSNPLATSGSLDLYRVTSDNVKLSYIEINGYFRNQQEVQIDKTKGGWVAGGAGSFSIFYSADGNQYNDYLRLSIGNDNIDWRQFGSLAFHWTQTCGNDVIEGATPVPEPASMLLLGIGMIGAGMLGRKRFTKKN